MISVLAETSDAVQIATLIAGLIGSMFAGVMAYLMARLNKKQEVAAARVEQVRTTLQETTIAADMKMDAIAGAVEETKERVNGQTKALLQINVASAKTLAENIDLPEHREAARVAEAALEAHNETDRAIQDGKPKQWPALPPDTKFSNQSTGAD